MKLSADRNNLLKVISHAQGVVERRTTVPILSHVRLDAQKGMVTITATDLDITYQEAIQCDVQEPNVVTVPVLTFYEILRKLPANSTVNLELNKTTNQISVTCGNVSFWLSVLPSEEFPEVDKETLPHQFKIESSGFCELIDRTRFAISLEETRYYLNGLFMHALEEPEACLRMVATDGHRLAKAQMALPQGAEAIPAVIIPRKTITELRKILEECETEIEIALSENQIRFSFHHTILLSRLIDGTFPDYQQVIPKENDKIATFNTKIFKEAIDRVSIMTNEKSRAVKLMLNKDQAVFMATSSEAGQAQEKTHVSYAHEPIEIGFNAKYLMDIVAQISTEELILSLKDPTTSAVFHTPQERSTLYILMPMRI